MDTLGFSLSCHPLERFRSILKNVDYVRACDLHAHVGKTITAVGWLVTGKTVHTKNGEPMKFVSFEDTTGLYETVFFPKVYHQFCHMLNEMRPYILKGKVEEDFGSITMTVNWIGFLDRYKGGIPSPRRENKMTRHSALLVSGYPPPRLRKSRQRADASEMRGVQRRIIPSFHLLLCPLPSKATSLAPFPTLIHMPAKDQHRWQMSTHHIA
jgi:DNA polymerase III alpha subunit